MDSSRTDPSGQPDFSRLSQAFSSFPAPQRFKKPPPGGKYTKFIAKLGSYVKGEV
jgi:hypothetical protein